MDIPAGIAAQAALTQQNIALSVIKQSAEADRQIANILTQAIENVPTSGRGGTLDISA